MSCLDFAPQCVSRLLGPIDQDVCGRYISPQLAVLRQFEARAVELLRVIESDSFSELNTFTGYSRKAKEAQCYDPVELLSHVSNAMSTLEIYIQDAHDIYTKDTSILEAAKMSNKWDHSYEYCVFYIKMTEPEALPVLHIAVFDSFKAFYHHLHKMSDSLQETRFRKKLSAFLSSRKGEFERTSKPEDFVYNITTTSNSMM